MPKQEDRGSAPEKEGNTRKDGLCTARRLRHSTGSSWSLSFWLSLRVSLFSVFSFTHDFIISLLSFLSFRGRFGSVSANLWGKVWWTRDLNHCDFLRLSSFFEIPDYLSPALCRQTMHTNIQVEHKLMMMKMMINLQNMTKRWCDDDPNEILWETNSCRLCQSVHARIRKM